jgi:hypothetical protein
MQGREKVLERERERGPGGEIDSTRPANHDCVSSKNLKKSCKHMCM